MRLATARVLLEFLQMFRVLFNVTWSWKIQKDLWWVQQRQPQLAQQQPSVHSAAVFVIQHISPAAAHPAVLLLAC
jgi:hypothetical protein